MVGGRGKDKVKGGSSLFTEQIQLCFDDFKGYAGEFIQLLGAREVYQAFEDLCQVAFNGWM
jgi:hypothetical protein